MRFDHGNGMLPMYTPGNFIYEIFCVFCVYDSGMCERKQQRCRWYVCCVVLCCVWRTKTWRRSGRWEWKKNFLFCCCSYGISLIVCRSHRLLWRMTYNDIGGTDVSWILASFSYIHFLHVINLFPTNNTHISFASDIWWYTNGLKVWLLNVCCCCCMYVIKIC